MDRRALEYQADRIEKVLGMHKVSTRVVGGTVTPRWVRFQVLPALGVRVSKIRNLDEELATALDVEHIRIARRGAAVSVEVPRDDPRPVRLIALRRQLLEAGEQIPSLTAILGLDEDGVPLLIRLPSPDVAHILIAGTTGSGKTVLLQTMTTSLALRHQPHALALVLIDPRGGQAFEVFGGLPHLARPIITDAEEAQEALVSLVRLMVKRDCHREKRRATVIVFIDELADLLLAGGNPVQEALTRLTQRGRGAGIHIVAATQKPTSAVLGPLVKANFPVRLVGKVTSAEDAKTASGWPGTGAERLMGRGDFLAIAEGRVIRFQTAHVSESEIETALQQHGWVVPMRIEPNKAKIEEAAPVVLPVLPEPEQEEKETNQVDELVERLRPWWQENGGEYGAKSGALRFLFGEDAPTGGYHWELTQLVITALEKESSTSTPMEKSPIARSSGSRLF